MGTKSWRAGKLLLVLMLAGAGAALAGANEDYQAALKSYRDGDVVGAMPGLRRAADAGNARAQVLLAEILDRSEFDEDAVAYYRKAAAQGDPDGMFGLGAMTAAGEGVKRKDVAEGRRWILQAAELGHRQAISVMAQAYLRGELGLTEGERNTAAALHWVQRAAQQDDLPAVDALALAYRTGGQLTLAADLRLAEQYAAQANRLRGIEPGKGRKKGKKIAIPTTPESK